MGPELRIDGKTYTILTSYPRKADAQAYAKRARKSGAYKSVRVVRGIHRSNRYYVCVRK